MLQLQTWMVLNVADLRARTVSLFQRGREGGATTLEYVVIAAVVFAAAIALAAVIRTAITTRQDDIYDGAPL